MTKKTISMDDLRDDQERWQKRLDRAEAALNELEAALHTLHLVQDTTFNTPRPEHEALSYLINQLGIHAGETRAALFPEPEAVRIA